LIFFPFSFLTLKASELKFNNDSESNNPAHEKPDGKNLSRTKLSGSGVELNSIQTIKPSQCASKKKKKKSKLNKPKVTQQK
jgi:hypothetical protein